MTKPQPGAKEYLQQLEAELGEQWDPTPGQTDAEELRDIEQYRSAQLGEPLDVSGLSERLRERFGEAPQFESKRAFRDYMLRHVLLPPIAGALPDELRPAFSSLVFGWLPTREPNAFALQAPNGESLAVLDHGLAMILSHYVEIMLTTTTLAPDAGNELLRRECSAIVDYFLRGGNRAIERTHAPLRMDQMLMVQELTFAMEQFILAHEFAHVHAGHLASCMNTRIATSHASVEVTKFTLDEEQELEADALAFGWLCGFLSPRPAGKYFTEYLRTMVLWLFEVFHIVEQHAPPPEHRTHPPAMVRVEALLHRYAAQLSMREGIAIADRIALVRRDPTYTPAQI